MRIVSINTERRDNVRVTFDIPVSTPDAIKYIAELYKSASGDKSIIVKRPADVVRDDDNRYAIVDGSHRCELFGMGGLTKQPPNIYHYIAQHHANDSERELLIGELEKACSQ